MNFVRDRADLRWLPSRHHFALARLVGYFVVRFGGPRAEPGLSLVVERDQSMAEHYTIAIWATVTAGCYIAAALTAWMPLWAAITVSIITTGLVVQIPLYTIGAVALPLWERLTGSKGTHHEKAISVAYMILYLLVASYFVRGLGWVRYVAAFSLLLFAANAVAAMLMFLLRGSVRKMEEQCGP